MLNQDLIKQFKHIKEGTMTGVLRLQEGDRIIRFYFEDGSLLLMDFGVDKEILMADQFITYHMIDDAMGQYAKTMYNDQQAAIAETLLKQQLVSQGEVDQVTRAMVEEILCHSFSTTHSTSWQNEQDVDITSFDLNKTSVKIRIDIDMLLSMVQSRIQERDAVQARLENWEIVYSFEEDAPPDSQLNDMERNVLRFVDGRQSINDIARSMRESCINIGIYLCSLENQRFIRKGGIRQTQPVSTPVTAHADTGTPAADAADSPFPDDEPATSTGATDAQAKGTGDFEVYSSAYKREDQKSSLGTIIIMLIILVAGGVTWAVWSKANAQHQQELLSTELKARTQNSQWAEAEQLLSKTKDLAGNDQVSLKRITDMVDDLRNGFEKDFEKIREMIEAKDYKGVQDKLNGYPLDKELIAFPNLWDSKSEKALKVLRLEAETMENVLVDESEAFSLDIRNALRSNNVSIAIQRIENRPDSIHESGWEYVTENALSILSRWRSDTLSDVSDPDKSYKWKFRQLANVSLARPTEREKQRIAELEGILTEQQNKLLSRLDDVPALLEAGNYISAGEILAQLEENSTALPDDKAALVLQLLAKKNDLESTITKTTNQLISQINSGLTHEGVKSAREAAAKVMEDYKALPNAKHLTDLIATADMVLTFIDLGSIKNELFELGKVKPDLAGIDNELLISRHENLTVIEKTSGNKLDEIKKQVREGAVDEAIVELNSFTQNTNYRRTTSFTEAELMLKNQLAQQKENEEIYQKFLEAILQDNVELVSKLLPKVKQKNLPFVVSSVPSGAKIFLNGADTGELTPKLYPPSSNADRAEMKFEIQKEGYRPSKIDTLGNSWRVRAILQRKPVVEINLEESINSRLAVINDELWVSSNKSVWKITKDGKAQSYKLENRASTIYAAAMRAEANGNIYVPTRDRVVLRIDQDGAVSNLPVSLSADHAVLHYVSEVMIDGEFIVMIDAVSGDIHAVNETDSKIQWMLKGSDRAACSPVLNGDKMLVLYRNGECKSIDVNSGKIIAEATIPNTPISAWSGENMLFAYAGKNLVAWDGKEIISEPLFKDIVNGGPGVIKTKDNRIRIPNANGQFNVVLGRITEDLTGQPILWNGHAVVPVGNTMHILGPRGFIIEAPKQMLEPILFGDLLIVASSDGQIRFLKQ